MLPVAGKPSIYHIIDRAAKAGVEDFVIITGYLRELMESEILAAYPKLKIQFVEQKEQLVWGTQSIWRVISLLQMILCC